MLIKKKNNPNHSTYKGNYCKCIKQHIYKENTKHTLLAQESSQNKARQAETYISSLKASVAYRHSAVYIRRSWGDVTPFCSGW